MVRSKSRFHKIEMRETVILFPPTQFFFRSNRAISGIRVVTGRLGECISAFNPRFAEPRFVEPRFVEPLPGKCELERGQIRTAVDPPRKGEVN